MTRHTNQLLPSCILGKCFTFSLSIVEQFCSSDCRLTTDEQLLPPSSHCSFVAFILNKLDKFRIKFWMLVDAQTNTQCSWNRAERQPSQAGDVRPRLMNGLFTKMCNATADNCFISATLVSTLSKRGRPLRESCALTSEKDQPDWNTRDWISWKVFSFIIRLITISDLKSKYVILFSTVHQSCTVDPTTKNKPFAFCFYNRNK